MQASSRTVPGKRMFVPVICNGFPLLSLLSATWLKNTQEKNILKQAKGGAVLLSSTVPTQMCLTVRGIFQESVRTKSRGAESGMRNCNTERETKGKEAMREEAAQRM